MRKGKSARGPLTILCAFLLLAAFLTPAPAGAAEEAGTLYPVCENGLWGYMNRAGEIVIEPRWAYARPFSGNTALVCVNGPADQPGSPPSGDGIIDRNGKYVIAPAENVYLEDYPFACRIRYRGGNDGENRAGYYDKISGFYQAPLAEYADVMLEGDDGTGPVAVRNRDGLTGYVDRATGKTVIPFIYTGQSADAAFHSGYARPADEILITDANGVTLLYASESYLIDTQGNELTFESGIRPASAVENGYFVYMMEMPDREDGAGSAAEDADAAENPGAPEDPGAAEETRYLEDEWYLGDGTKIAFPLFRVYGAAGIREEMLNPQALWDETETKIGYGLAKTDGTIVCGPDPEISRMRLPDSDGMVCIVSVDGACGHMDTDGSVLVPPRYVVDSGGAEVYYAFRHGYAVIEDRGENYPDTCRWVVIDKAGNEIFSRAGTAEDGSEFRLCGDAAENGLVWYETPAGYGLMKLTDHGAEDLSGAVYEASLGCGAQDSGDDTGFREGLHPVKQNGLWGYIDERAEWVVEPRYDGAAGFRDGLALVEKDGKKMYIDREGTAVWTEN